MPRSEPQMLRDLAPHLEKFNTCVLGALTQYKEQYGALAHQHSPRTQSSIINDLMVNAAREQFIGVSGVNVLRKRGTVVLDFSAQYLVKFKKLSPAKRASFIETQAALEFVNQVGEVQGEFDIGDPATNLFVGYVLHPAEMLKSAAWVVCPNGRRVEWSYEIVHRAAVVPLLPKTAAPERKRRRVRAKNPANKKATRDGTNDE